VLSSSELFKTSLTYFEMKLSVFHFFKKFIIFLAFKDINMFISMVLKRKILRFKEFLCLDLKWGHFPGNHIGISLKPLLVAFIFKEKNKTTKTCFPILNKTALSWFKDSQADVFSLLFPLLAWQIYEKTEFIYCYSLDSDINLFIV